MITEFWQTEKDFIEFLNVIYDAGAELYSYRGNKYNGLPFKDIYTTEFQGLRIFFKDAEVPIEHNEKYTWISLDAESISYRVPVLAKGAVWNGGICLSKRYDSKTDTYLPHSEEYKALFKKLSKYIKKNYTISKDKFAYAGPDFLNEWKNGSLSASNGPPRPISPYRAEFEIK